MKKVFFICLIYFRALWKSNKHLFDLFLLHMGDFEQLLMHKVSPSIFQVCFTNAKRMEFSDTIDHCKMRLYKN